MMTLKVLFHFYALNKKTVISEDKLQVILAGISEITEDFEKQSAVLERMVEVKFDGILDGKSIDEIRKMRSLSPKPFTTKN